MKSVRDAGVVSAVVAVLVYLNSLDCGMVYDDEYAIKWNQDIRPHTKWTHLLVHDFWGASSEQSYQSQVLSSTLCGHLQAELHVAWTGSHGLSSGECAPPCSGVLPLRTALWSYLH